MKLKMFFCAGLLMFGLYSFSSKESDETIEIEDIENFCTGGDWVCTTSVNNKFPRTKEEEDFRIFNFLNWW